MINTALTLIFGVNEESGFWPSPQPLSHFAGEGCKTAQERSSMSAENLLFRGVSAQREKVSSSQIPVRRANRQE
jgi:hypothetical protein